MPWFQHVKGGLRHRLASLLPDPVPEALQSMLQSVLLDKFEQDELKKQLEPLRL